MNMKCYVEQQNPNAKEHILYEPVYLMTKSRQNNSRQNQKMVSSGQEEWKERDKC